MMILLKEDAVLFHVNTAIIRKISLGRRGRSACLFVIGVHVGVYTSAVPFALLEKLILRASIRFA